MKVIRSKVLGFCMGVRRAVEFACAEAKQAYGRDIYTLGSLVHNPRVLDDLEKLGIITIDELPSKLEGSSVIIRAHGVSAAVEKDIRGRGARIKDATCPIVKASQIEAEKFSHAGYCLFIAGEENHAEIEGILGYVQSSFTPFCVVVGSAQEAGKAAKRLFSINRGAKTALLGQTTISEKEYQAIGESIKVFFPNLEIANTICAATKERQCALRELLDQVDAVVIAGCKESANTRRLLAIAKESGKPCSLAESADEIPSAFFAYESVGISAGASTPDYVIDEIEKRLIT